MTPKIKLPKIMIFADGASSGNPGPGGWGAVLVSDKGHVKELGGRAPETTNNRMELAAVIESLDCLKTTTGDVAIYTDSVYVIRGITQWIWAWQKRGWKTAEGGEVSNTDLWKKLSALVMKRGKENPISWHFVKGHSGIPGNERVDEIAVSFSKGRRPALYEGPLLKYPVPIHDIPEDTSLPEMKPREETVKKEAFSYLSLLGDTPERHANWADCERRVKGRSGAKFKKAMNEEEEKSILKSWGYSPEKLKKK